MLNGLVVPEVEHFRYLGIMFNNKLSNETHLEKRRQATFAVLNRIKKLGFDAGNMHPKLLGNMFKTYVRPVLMYGCETLDLNKSEIEKISKCEGTALKRMLGLKKRCYTRHLFNAVQIGTTDRYIKMMKIKFFVRLNQNAYTKRILEEWFQINPKSQYKLWINEEFSLVPDLHYDGSLVSTEEKCNIRIETIKELNSMNQQDDPVASKVRLLFKIQDKFKRIQSIEAVVHAKNVAREII